MIRGSVQHERVHPVAHGRHYSEISDLKRQEADRQTMIDNYQAMIEAQYASMEATLSLLQSQSAQINSTLGISTSSSSSTGAASASRLQASALTDHLPKAAVRLRPSAVWRPRVARSGTGTSRHTGGDGRPQGSRPPGPEPTTTVEPPPGRPPLSKP